MSTTASQIIRLKSGKVLIGSKVPEPVARHAILLKILSGVNITDAGCWVWTGYCHPQWGYGETTYLKKVWRIHRLIWTIMKGEIPEGFVIRHKCDNAPCCNPDHLVPGTDADNVADRIRRGRDHHSNLTECPHGHPYSGENLWVDSRGFRHCKACARARGQDPAHIEWRREYQRKRRAKRLAAKLLGQSRTGTEP